MSDSFPTSLPIAAIKIPEVLLRDVDKMSDSFQLLVGDIQKHGIEVPLIVREVVAENGAKLYYLIEGRQRLGAAELIGLPEVPVKVKVCDNNDAIISQMRLNLHRSQPAPAAYAKQLKEFLILNPATSFAALAAEVGEKPEWIRERLKLTELLPELQAKVDSGDITVLNGIALAKLDQEDQESFAAKAESMPNVEFAQIVQERKKTVEAARKACKPKPVEGFNAVPLLRSKAELMLVKDLPESAPEIAAIINAAGVTPDNPAGAVKATIDWIFQLDAASVESRRQVWEADQARAKEEKARRQEENAAKKAEADALKAQVKAEKDAAESARKLVMS